MARRYAVFFAAAVVLAASLSRADAVKLRYNLKQGRTVKYKQTMKAVGQMSSALFPKPLPVKAESVATYTETVRAVTGEGNYKMQQYALSGSLTATVMGNKRSTPLPKGVFKTYELTTLGKPLNAVYTGAQYAEGGGDLGGRALMAALNYLTFPEGDVQPGGRWSYTELVDVAGSDPVEASFTSRLVGVKVRNGRNSAILRSHVSIPIQMAQMLGNEQASFELDTWGTAGADIAWSFDIDRSVVTSAQVKGKNSVRTQAIGPNGESFDMDMAVSFDLALTMLQLQ